jgi:hypothetical protein
LFLKEDTYARINASASVSGGVVTVRYEVNPTSPSFEVSDVYGYWNFAPGIDDGVANYAGKITVSETSGEIKFDLYNDQTYKDNHYKIQANGNRIYVRIGAKIDEKVNYSVILEVTVRFVLYANSNIYLSFGALSSAVSRYTAQSGGFAERETGLVIE